MTYLGTLLQLVILPSLVLGAHQHRYSNYQVIRVMPSTLTQVRQLRVLEQNQKCQKLDFWTSSRGVGAPVDIMVSPETHDYLHHALTTIGAPYHTMITNVDALIQTQSHDAKGIKETSTDEHYFSTYHDFEEIQNWITDLVIKYSNLVTDFEIGRSYEDRPMRVLKISTGGENEGHKQEVWFEGAIHAREWISPSTVMFITNQLLEDYTNGLEEVVRTLDCFDIYVLIVTNPDGYQFTWDKERLWRKTRSPNEGVSCHGTDPNRNWPYEWGGEGSSAYACSETYRGTFPASEVEINSVVNFLSTLNNLKLFIDFHSYSQLILYPWGYMKNAPIIPNVAEVDELAMNIAEAIESVNGRHYTYGNSVDVLYASAGCSIDYAYSIGIDFTYVIELPDTGEYGFLLPEEEIKPTGIETYVGILAAFQYLLDQ